MLERADLAFDRTIATAQVASMNIFLALLKVAQINGVLQFVFLVLSIFYLIWKWRRDVKGPNTKPKS